MKKYDDYDVIRPYFSYIIMLIIVIMCCTDSGEFLGLLVYDVTT